MAQVKFDKGSEEWMMFTEYWSLCQSVWQTEDSDEYWQEAHDKCKSFGEKYNGICGEFARSLALSLLDYLGKKGAKNEVHSKL